MDKRTGNLCASLISVVAICFFLPLLAREADVSAALRVVDQRGKPLQKAGIGIPFVIDVEVMAGSRHQQRHPQLITPPTLQVVQRGTSNSVRSINGETIVRTTFSYQAVADEEGVVTIGPARVETASGDVVESNTVRLTIAPEQEIKNEDRQVGGAFIELKVDNQEPFVGEAVSFSIRFYSTQENTHLEQLQEPLFKGFRHTALEGPATGTTKKNGIEYQYLEWKALIFPTQEGRLVIPSLLAYVTLPLEHPRNSRGMDMFTLVNHMFGAGKTEQIYSNALTLQVKPLPAHDPATTAIGKFSSFHAKLSSPEAETGEGVTLTLELVGQGNFQMIGHPKVVMPEGLKHYDSHAKDHLLTATMVKKDFEYVVQAVRPGAYEIPSQSFTYFDSKAREYKVLHSRPVKLTVRGEMKNSTKQVDIDQSVEKIDRPEEMPPLEKTLKGGGLGKRDRLPWLLFLCIALLLSIPLFWKLAVGLWLSYHIRNASSIGYNRAFKLARGRIKSAHQHKNDSELYHILMDLFSARLQVPRSEISEADIEHALRKAGLSEEQIAEWRKFFSHVMAVAFSALPASGDLYEKLSYWIAILEGLL